ncbi:MAG: TetR/AcrR family transcriptional regulator [Roseburia sp.]|nr:TetR/AcrR family transcriptional regulator [Ruminococcus sp.]MCM1155078.1 TetR/AcrR family transcriptional regulator [Roseburia sp.]MCM1242889.1 TetR/AcrR family transcriptional regulator [Roseburia sp.]
MPTERFFNLPQEKQERVYQAAFDELTRVPYDELSINQIIRKADIPRGSFYQYFENKEDLLVYIMSSFQDCFKEYVRKAMKESNGDIFLGYWNVLNQMIVFGEQEKHYRIMKNVFSGLRVAEVKAFEIFGNLNDSFSQQIYDLADSSVFDTTIVGSYEDFLELLDFLGIITRNALVEIFADISRKDMILGKVKKRLRIIKYGVMKKEEE